LPVLHLPGFRICCKSAGKLAQELCSVVKGCRRAAPVYPNQTGPIASQGALLEFGQSCLPQVSVSSTSVTGGTSTSCSGGIPRDTLSRLLAVQFHHRLSPLVESSGVSHVPSTEITFPVLSFSLFQPPFQSEGPTNHSVSPSPSTLITSLVFPRLLAPERRS